MPMTKTKTITLRARKVGHRLDFYQKGPERTAEIMSLFGLAAKFTAQVCNLSSPQLVYYRNRKCNIRIRDFRDGKSPMAAFLVGHFIHRAEKILDAHLENLENSDRPVELQIEGQTLQTQTVIRRLLLNP
jgi:hypothetical protein